MSRGWVRPVDRRVGVVVASAVLASIVGFTQPWDAAQRGPRSAAAASAEAVVRRDYAIGGFKAPPRWDLRPRDRSSYPQLLAWAERVQGSERAVMTLVGERVAPGTTLQSFAEKAAALRSQARLKNLRLLTQRAAAWPGGQRIQVDAQLATQDGQRPQLMRQYLFLNPPFGYVLTVVTPVEQAAARFRDLEDTAADLVPLSPDPDRTDRPAP